MLLSLRSLWETTSAAVVEVVVTGHTSRKIQRRLRRLARWSEAISLPRIAVVIKGAALPPLRPAIIPGTVVITRHVAVYNKGTFQAGISVIPFIGVDVAIFARDEAIKSSASLAQTGMIEANIDLLKEEITALAMLAA